MDDTFRNALDQVKLETALELLTEVVARIRKHEQRRQQQRTDPVTPPPPPPPPPALPELWFHGAPMAPERVMPLSAKGGRMFVDCRQLAATVAASGAEAAVESILPLIMLYHDLGLGLALTLRWMDPANKDAPDIAPTEDEASNLNKAIYALWEKLSVQAMARSGRLWVQFFNEVAGGPGTIRADREGELDRMFQWATTTTEDLMEWLPGVKICGPALTAPTVILTEPSPTDSAVTTYRREILTRAIRWSMGYADAIDLHLHVGDLSEAEADITCVQSYMQGQCATHDHLDAVPILTFEWSPAKFEPRHDDPAGVVALMEGLYRLMTAERFPIAAYACVYPAYAMGSNFHWQSVYHLPQDAAPGTAPTRNEPIYSTLARIGAGEVKIAAAPPTADAAAPATI